MLRWPFLTSTSTSCRISCFVVGFFLSSSIQGKTDLLSIQAVVLGIFGGVGVNGIHVGNTVVQSGDFRSYYEFAKQLYFGLRVFATTLKFNNFFFLGVRKTDP
jgi:hypothetical protein